MKRALPDPEDAAAAATCAKRPDVPAFPQFEALLPELQGEVRRRLDLPTRAALARTCRAMCHAPDALPRLPPQWRAEWDAVPGDFYRPAYWLPVRMRRGFRRLLEAGLAGLVLRRPWHMDDDGTPSPHESIVWEGRGVHVTCVLDTGAWTLTVVGHGRADAPLFTELSPEAVALVQRQV